MRWMPSGAAMSVRNRMRPSSTPFSSTTCARRSRRSPELPGWSGRLARRGDVSHISAHSCSVTHDTPSARHAQ